MSFAVLGPQVSRGICSDAITDTNTFRIDAPIDFGAPEKALLIGATFLMVIFPYNDLL